MNKGRIVVVVIIVIALIIGIVYFYHNLSLKNHAFSTDIQGTYCTQESDETYLVFDSQGQYCKYQQYNMIYEGKYTVSNSDSNVIQLENNCIIKNGDLLYEPDGNNANIYNKIDDGYTFINVKTKNKYK